MQGIIKTLKNGFGFITVEGSDKDLFFHASDMNGEFNDLREGDTVTFEEVPSDRGGMKAGNVTAGGGAAPAAAAPSDDEEAAEEAEPEEKAEEAESSEEASEAGDEE